MRQKRQSVLLIVTALAVAGTPSWAQQQQQQEQQNVQYVSSATIHVQVQYQQQQAQPIQVHGQGHQQAQQQQQWVQQQQAQHQQYQQQWQHHQAGQGPAPSIAKVAPQQEKRPIRAVIDGKRYGVTVNAQKRLAALVRDYRITSTVGKTVSAFAAFLHLFGIFETEDVPGDLAGALKIGLNDPFAMAGDSDATVHFLSAPYLWDKTMRDSMGRVLQYEALDAEKRGETEERKMWLHLRDIILNYERYENDGIQIDRDDKRRGDIDSIDDVTFPAAQPYRIMLRAMPGEKYRSIASIEGPFEWQEQDQLLRMVASLSTFPAASDMLATADFTLNLDYMRSKLESVSKRDLMLLNRALRSLPPHIREAYRQTFLANKNVPTSNKALWEALAQSTLHDDYWNWNATFDEVQGGPFVDALGFPTDDVQPYRWKDWAFRTPLHPVPYYWVGPAPMGAYTFFWSSGAPIVHTPTVYTFHWPGPM